jgi:hypothetical protein
MDLHRRRLVVSDGDVAVNVSDWIAMRLRVPATASEIAATACMPVHLARGYLYQLRKQGRAVRLDKQVPKASSRGRQWEYLWQANR